MDCTWKGIDFKTRLFAIAHNQKNAAMIAKNFHEHVRP